MIIHARYPFSSPKPFWYVLYTRSRHEKWIDRELQKNRIESFLPTRKIKRRWSDRTVVVEEPLFHSYLFVRADVPGIQQVLKTKGAVRLVSSAGRPVPVDESVIASLRAVVDFEMAVDPFPYLGVGDRVAVCRGVFQGAEGHIVRKNSKKCRLVISIDAIMASVSVEVDACLVEKL